jgi:hypothetical protein
MLQLQDITGEGGSTDYLWKQTEQDRQKREEDETEERERVWMGGDVTLSQKDSSVSL